MQIRSDQWKIANLQPGIEQSHGEFGNMRHKKWSVVARVSIEAQHPAITQGVCEFISIGRILKDLRFPRIDHTKAVAVTVT